MNPELEPEDVDAGFSHQIDPETEPENNDVQFSHQANPEYEDFIADLKSKIQESGDYFDFHLEIPGVERRKNPELSKVNLLSDFVSKRYYREENENPEVLEKISDLKYVIYELAANMYDYDKNGTKIISIEGNFKNGRVLVLTGRGEGPDPKVRKIVGVDAKEIVNEVYQLKPGSDEEVDTANLELEDHGRGLPSIVRLTDLDHLSIVLDETKKENENPTYVYTIFDSLDRDIEAKDLEKIAA